MCGRNLPQGCARQRSDFGALAGQKHALGLLYTQRGSAHQRRGARARCPAQSEPHRKRFAGGRGKLEFQRLPLPFRTELPRLQTGRLQIGQLRVGIQQDREPLLRGSGKCEIDLCGRLLFRFTHPDFLVNRGQSRQRKRR